MFYAHQALNCMVPLSIVQVEYFTDWSFDVVPSEAEVTPSALLLEANDLLATNAKSPSRASSIFRRGMVCFENTPSIAILQ
jgi:hypothetical protein